MHDVIVAANVQQPLTFPIRAGIAAAVQSHDNIVWLLDQLPGSTLTLWGTFYDTVDVAGLARLIRLVGKERVYIDVPHGLACEINRYLNIDKWLSNWVPITRYAIRWLGSVTYAACAASYAPWRNSPYLEP